MRKPALAAALPLAAALALPLTAPAPAAAEDPLLHLQAFSINLINAARTNTIDIVIERWSTPAEIDKLRGILIEKGGGDSLLSAVQKVKPRCGYVRTSKSGRKFLSLSVKPKQDKPAASEKLRADEFNDDLPF